MLARYGTTDARIYVCIGGYADRTFLDRRSTGSLAGLMRVPGAVRSCVLVGLTVLGMSMGCAEPQSGPRVVARGRYVELVTAREDPICAGTIGFLDATVDAAFDFIGETPPDGVFIRYEWLSEPEEQVSLVGEGFARKTEDGILIRTDQLVHEHELAHAVHLTAWPDSARFMHEGLAILLDGRRIYDQNPWPSELALDEVLDDPLEGGRHYPWAWFLVSQIILDHGIDGLRDLWFAVPERATAQEVRAAYQQLFGRSIDVFLEPRPHDAYPTTDTRYACQFSLCPGEPAEPEGDRLVAPGPAGCEDDPDAIGPHSRGLFIDGPPVWRETILEPDDAYTVEGSDTLALVRRPCFMICDLNGSLRTPWLPTPVQGEWDIVLTAERWRIEARRDLEDLPTDEPGAIQLHPWQP